MHAHRTEHLRGGRGRPGGLMGGWSPPESQSQPGGPECFAAISEQSTDGPLCGRDQPKFEPKKGGGFVMRTGALVGSESTASAGCQPVRPTDRLPACPKQARAVDCLALRGTWSTPGSAPKSSPLRLASPGAALDFRPRSLASRPRGSMAVDSESRWGSTLGRAARGGAGALAGG